jgi:hypothetical protein
MASIPKEHRLLAVALLNYSDDEGYFMANEALIRGECFPFDEDSKSVRRGLQELSRIGYIALGTSSDGQKIGSIPNFLEHQRIDKASPSKIKTKTITWEDSANPPRIIQESSTPEGNKEGKGKGKGNARIATPIPEDFALSDRVLKWASQQGLAGVIELHFEAFVSTCKAKGYNYVDWDEAFMNAVRKNWAKIEAPRSGALKVAM